MARCRFLLAVVTLSILSFQSQAADAPAQPASVNSIDAINVLSGQGGKIVVKITTKQPLANPPVSFSVNNPPRIAFDFPNAVNGLGKNTQEIGNPELRSVRIGQSTGRTRVVLNLARPVRYETQLDGNDFLISIQAGSALTSLSENENAQFARGKTDMPHAMLNLDFRRGKTGEGQVIIDLSDNATGIDIRRQGKSVIVDLLQTQIPANLQRRLDVTDFATPVDTVVATKQGSNAKIVITPHGNWEHSAYQTDNRLIVEVKGIVEDTTKIGAASGRGYTGDKLSLNFQNIEVRAVLQVLADFTGLNIITSDTVSGNLTLRLKDVPWDQALDIILQAKGLDMRKNGNVVWIAPRDELATKEKLAPEAQQQIQELEPTRTESFQLNYMKAEAFQKLVSDPNQRILSKRGSAVIDPRTNTLFIQDTSSKLEEVAALIKKIDVAVRQVLIEARIVEATDTFGRSLGARLGTVSLGGGGGFQPFGGDRARLFVGGNSQSVGVQTGQAQDYPQSFTDSFAVNLPAPSLGTMAGNAGAFTFTLFNPSQTRFLNLELSALQLDARGKLLSSPRVITADNVEANIEQGTEIPYQTATASGATSIRFRKATLSLKVKPQITPDDNVIMQLEVHKDSVGVTTQAGPAIDTKQVQTEVLVENGGTVGIGGIYTQDERQQQNKIPVLGDIPIIGFFFRNELRINDRRELLVFVTPKILNDNLSVR
ncbi:MAG: type IV pilus secretin PilQ [Betaproteobacteria bacterium]|nr:type IV pilus secretin PilQ [Betaproteobacteria bacterium]